MRKKLYFPGTKKKKTKKNLLFRSLLIYQFTDQWKDTSTSCLYFSFLFLCFLGFFRLPVTVRRHYQISHISEMRYISNKLCGWYLVSGFWYLTLVYYYSRFYVHSVTCVWVPFTKELFFLGWNLTSCVTLWICDSMEKTASKTLSKYLFQLIEIYVNRMTPKVILSCSFG